MDSERAYATAIQPPDLAAPARPALIAIGFYKNEHLVAAVLQSLIDCADDLIAISAEVVLFNDSPDYAPLADALADMMPRAAALFPCRVETNTENLGFVRTMNLAIAEAVERGYDLLLLNSDTRVNRGALPEMARVLNTDPSIAFVNPRSNNATIATLPGPKNQHAYDALARMLPAISYVPTAVGFCMLIRWQVLAEFGGFDEIYGHGYNEENDLVMRVSRCGYRAVLANRAFVWHEGETSFSAADVTRDTWEKTNRAILDSRYPEYGTYTAAHYDLPETIAENLLAAVIPDSEGKRELALDFSSFREAHNGTFQAGRQLLAASRKIWGDRFNTTVLCSQGVYDFHGYAALGIPRCDPHTARRFAVIFRVGQPYDWNAIQRMCVSGAVLGVYMLDTISIDCPQLSSPRLYNMWQFTLNHMDVIATISRQAADNFGRRFRIPPHVINLVSPLSLDLDEYLLPVADQAPAKHAATLVVLGNHFHHKYLSPTANALARAFPDRAVVALGQEKPAPDAAPDPWATPPLIDVPNLTGQKIGDLDDAQIGAFYAAADALIFPSHAEGFGIPAMNALAAKRPVFLRKLPVFVELWEYLDRNPNIHFYDSTSELIAQLRDIPAWIDFIAANPERHGAERSAREIVAALELALGQVSFARIVDRVRSMQFASDISNPTGTLAPGQGVRVEAAHLVALQVEKLVRVAFRVGPIYFVFRTMFRVARAARRMVRR